MIRYPFHSIPRTGLSNLPKIRQNVELEKRLNKHRLDPKITTGSVTQTGGAALTAMPLFIGLSHKTATVEVREKLAIPEAKWNEASKALCEYDSIKEAAVLSTCNRFEVAESGRRLSGAAS